MKKKESSASSSKVGVILNLILLFLAGVFGGVLLSEGVVKVKDYFSEEVETRQIKATVTAKYYYEDGNYYSVEFTDEEGHQWIMENCDYNLGEDCLLTFETQGTDEIDDDVIIAVGINTIIDRE